MPAKSFPLDEVLAVAKGVVLARRGREGCGDVCNHLFSGTFTEAEHMARAGEAEAAIAKQHPDLAAIQFPQGGLAEADVREAWILSCEQKYGSTRTVTPIKEL